LKPGGLVKVPKGVVAGKFAVGGIELDEMGENPSKGGEDFAVAGWRVAFGSPSIGCEGVNRALGSSLDLLPSKIAAFEKLGAPKGFVLFCSVSAGLKPLPKLKLVADGMVVAEVLTDGLGAVVELPENAVEEGTFENMDGPKFKLVLDEARNGLTKAEVVAAVLGLIAVSGCDTDTGLGAG